MKKILVILTVGLLSISIGFSQQKASKQQRKAAKRESSRGYYEKWLKESVAYIIMDEEEDVFRNLATDEERDQFIEQFWRRRDPDPSTPINEFREEHYRRIAYVNQKFGSGVPGWKTDRGRLYITFGPPDIIEDHPSGGWYYRPSNEGGGATSTFPFQIWTYNYIEGIGDQLEVQFVDPSWSGEYHMALDPSEKDALLHVGFLGPTDAELEGRLSKLDRPYYSPGNYRDTHMQAMLGLGMKDKPFERMTRFYQLQKPVAIKFKDLKAKVTTNVSYHMLPFRLRYDYLSISARQVLVPITLEIDNKNLRFTKQPLTNAFKGQVNIYGRIQNLTGRVMQEFEDTVTIEFPESQMAVRKARKSAYQKIVLLPPGRYKLTMAIKDDHSENVGTLESSLILPRMKEDELDASSIILARSLQPLKPDAATVVPFALGDLKVVPNVTSTFDHRDDMGVYVQIYNAEADERSQPSALEVEYQILKDGKIVKRFLDPKQNSVLDYNDRLVLVQAFDLDDLQQGDYTLRVEVYDQIKDKRLQRSVGFSVTAGS